MAIEHRHAFALTHLGRECYDDSARWFPELHNRTPHELAIHYTLGAAGEVGELVNLVKKVDRDSLAWADVYEEVGFEIVDTIIYLLDLATHLGIDPGQALLAKHAVLEARYTGTSG